MRAHTNTWAGRSNATARAAAVGVMMLACVGAIAAPASSARAPGAPKASVPMAAEAKRGTIAVTDWIAADAVRLLAGDDFDVVVVPGLGASTPARGAAAAALPERAGEAGDSVSDGTALDLSDQVKAAIGAAQGLLSTNEDGALHEATREMSPHQAALVSAIRPQLRVKRGDGTVEPAFWVDAALWARTVSVARQTLAKIAPEMDQSLMARAQDVRGRLMTLNDEMLLRYSELPRDAVLVVGAEGLGQIGRVHEREVRVVPSSLKTEGEQQAMRALVDLIILRKTPVVFPIDGAPNANIDELVKRVRARGGAIRVGEALHVDTPLAGDDGSAGAVERMIRHNARVVRDGFTSKGLPTAK